MRRPLIIAGATLGALVLLLVGLLAFAYFNLNSIIAPNRDYIVKRASAALGRPITVAEIKGSLGWGIAIDLRDVRLADDPAFSPTPFLQAHDAYLQVELIPLLVRSMKIRRLVITRPQIQLIRDREGIFNFSTIAGGQPHVNAAERTHPVDKPPQASSMAQLQNSEPPRTSKAVPLAVRDFQVEDGTIDYKDAAAGGSPITLRHCDLKVSDFSASTPFNVVLSVAAFGDRKNLEVTGRAGPLIHNGASVLGIIPLNLAAVAGPLTLAQIETMPQLARALPSGFSVSGPLRVDAQIRGTLEAIRVAAITDLSSNHIVYTDRFEKPAGLGLKLDLAGGREHDQLALSRLHLTLADLELEAADLAFHNDNFAGRIDTNRFELAPLARVLALVRKYAPVGVAEVHAKVAVARGEPSATGTLTLTQVGLTAPGAPPISDLRGTIALAGQTATAAPLTFNLGSGHATLNADAESLAPLRATFRLGVDRLKPGEFVPSRAQLGEQMAELTADGSLGRAGDRLSVSAKVASSSGILAKVPYSGLAVDGAYVDSRVTIASLTAAAFNGTIGASGLAILGNIPRVELNINADGIDLQRALESQKAKAAETIRGHLSGNLRITGAGRTFDEIRPTLRGQGGAETSDGGLVGVNVVAEALGKINILPGIGAIVPASVIANHPELFKSNDTAIDQARLTFTVYGPRLTSHDIAAYTADYTILGDGWFDMDKNLDLAARILLSRPFSRQLVAARRNAKYLEAQSGQIEIPLRISGRLPKPAVMPDTGTLARRVGSHAIEDQLGNLLGGNKSGGPAPKSSNPFGQLKKLFH